MPSPDHPLAGASIRRLARHHARQRLGLAPSGLVALHQGRMAPRSGIDTIILGLALLRRHCGIGATLLVTDGDRAPPATAERARLRQLARELGIEAQVHFMAGNASSDCAAAADVLISVPWPAPRGGACRQTMGWIRPLLGCGHGRPASPVIDGVTGWLVAPRDAAALARHLARLHRQPELMQAVDVACQLRVPA